MVRGSILLPTILNILRCKKNISVTVFLYSCSGISEEKTLNPVQLATMKAERIAREKAAASQNAVV